MTTMKRYLSKFQFCFKMRKKNITRLMLAVMIMLAIFLINNLFSEVTINNLSLPPTYSIFFTAMGIVHLKEISENVFEKNDYEIVQNDLVPVLKKRNLESCENIFSSWHNVAENNAKASAPKILPDSEAFLLNNYSRLLHLYYNDTPQNSEGAIKTWDLVFIDLLIYTAKKYPFEVQRPYNNESLAVYAATKYFDITGQEGAVIGSLTPWAEAYILANGAKHVTTIDYQKVFVYHSQIDFLYALDLPSLSKEYYAKFDFVLSFSSIEHSGLGRYGDPMDPIGDIREMKKIQCLLKPKGLLFLGLPVGVDGIVFNAHRIYGRIRLAMMFEGFRLLKIFHCSEMVSREQIEHAFTNDKDLSPDQYLFVLEKMD